MVNDKGQQNVPIASFLGVKLSWETSLLVRSKILELFVKTLIAHDKYSCYKRENFPQENQMQLSKTPKSFMNLLLHFWNLLQVFNILEKRLSLRGQVIPKLWTRKKRGYLNIFKTAFEDTL